MFSLLLINFVFLSVVEVNLKVLESYVQLIQWKKKHYALQDLLSPRLRKLSVLCLKLLILPTTRMNDWRDYE